MVAPWREYGVRETLFSSLKAHRVATLVFLFHTSACHSPNDDKETALARPMMDDDDLDSDVDVPELCEWDSLLPYLSTGSLSIWINLPTRLPCSALFDLRNPSARPSHSQSYNLSILSDRRRFERLVEIRTSSPPAKLASRRSILRLIRRTRFAPSFTQSVLRRIDFRLQTFGSRSWRTFGRSR